MTEEIIPVERIQQKIYLIRGQKVILDRELASLYGVSTKVLKQAVRRNIERFPGDFMFLLDNKEFANWRSQIVTSNSDKMGLRHAPMAFTEQGVAMLSGVLNSPRRSSKHRDHAGLCPPAGIAFVTGRVGCETRGARDQIRRTVSCGFPSYSGTDGPARSATQADWFSGAGEAGRVPNG